MRLTYLTCWLTVVVLSSGVCQARMLDVPGSFATIQLALDSGQSNDTVVVDSGRYSGPGFENLLYDTDKMMWLISKWGQEKTRINVKTGLGFIACKNSWEHTRGCLVIDGFTIYGFDAGVAIGDGACALVIRCTFLSCASGVRDVSYGGNNCYIDSCNFFRCDLGVEFNDNSWMGLWRSDFRDNGTAIWFSAAQYGYVTSCNIVGNGLGIYFRHFDFNDSVTKCVIYNNYIGAYREQTWPISDTARVAQLVVGNDVFGSSSGQDYLHMPDLTGRSCNISVDPYLCDTTLASHTVASISPLLPQNNYCHFSIGDVSGVACYCGDVDVSGNVDISDIVVLVSYMYTGGSPPVPLEAGEIDGSTPIDISDLTYLVAYLYLSGPRPPCGG